MVDCIENVNYVMDGMEPMVDLMENNMLYDCRNKLSTLEPLEYIMAEFKNSRCLRDTSRK